MKNNKTDSVAVDSPTDQNRFKFGDNWHRFLGILSEERILSAEESLRNYLGVEDLAGLRFLDAGSGSGLFSLAARRMGARVHSFDFDSQSVACTNELRTRYCPDDEAWVVEQASVLDQNYLSGLGVFDVVYSWGVLHHTGRMWDALGNVAPLVAADGKLFVAIYNDQGWISNYWLIVKKLYVSGTFLQIAMLLLHSPYLFLARLILRSIRGKTDLERGMSIWYDMIDWIGGYPFEVARPEQIFDFYHGQGFKLIGLKTCGGRHGCNELVFSKSQINIASLD